MAQRDALRYGRHAARGAAVTSFFYASTAAPPTTNGRRSTRLPGNPADQRGGRSPNLGCASPITPLTQSRATIEAAIAAMGPGSRRHHRQPRARLGLAHDLAALARALGRGRPAARLRYRLHGQGRGDPDRRPELVPRSGHDRGAAFGLHRLRPGGTPRGRSASRPHGGGAGGTILDARMAGTCTAMKAENRQRDLLDHLRQRGPDRGDRRCSATARARRRCATARRTPTTIADVFPRHRRPTRQPADHRVTRDARRCAT